MPIDGVRRITNRFSGRLGALVAEELYLRGADVRLVHGQGAFQPPAYLPVTLIKSYDEYRQRVGELAAEEGCRFGVFTAAVADYRPKRGARRERCRAASRGRSSWSRRSR